MARLASAALRRPLGLQTRLAARLRSGSRLRSDRDPARAHARQVERVLAEADLQRRVASIDAHRCHPVLALLRRNGGRHARNQAVRGSKIRVRPHAPFNVERRVPYGVELDERIDGI